MKCSTRTCRRTVALQLFQNVRRASRLIRGQRTTNQIEHSMKRTVLLASVFASLFAVTPQSNAGGTSGTQNGYFYFTYYTGSGTTTITLAATGSNWRGTWTSGITDSLCGRGWPQNNLVRNI